MSNEEIKKGDIVQLKSGGPQMTVVLINSKDEAECFWFLPDMKKRTDSFPIETLSKITSPGVIFKTRRSSFFK